MTLGTVVADRTLRFLVTISLVLALGACGNGENRVVEASDPVDLGTAFNFSENNMDDAAGIGIKLLELIPRFSGITLGLFDLFMNRVAVANIWFRPTGIISIPVGDDLCLGGGRAQLRWKDADNNAQLSRGDSAELDLVSCDFVDDERADTVRGVVTFGFISGALTGSTAIEANLTLSVQISDDAGSQTLVGNFGLSVTRSDLMNYTATYTAEDPDGFLRAREGPQNIRLGCFNIVQTFSIGTLEEGYYNTSLSPNAVVNANGKTFSVTSSGFAPLAFQPHEVEDYSYPDAGGIRFFSYLLPGEEGCAAVGSPDGVGDSDGSNFILWAPPGDSDDVTLELRDQADNTVATVNTTWAELAD